MRIPLPMNDRSRSLTRRSHRLLDIGIVFILVVLALSQYLRYLDETPVHPDESRWLNRAHYLTDLTDPFGPTWNDQYLIRGQPPLGSYVMGFGLLVQGRDLTTNPPWDFRRGREWNTERGAFPDRADLLAGRRTNVALGTLAVVIVYFVAKRLSNRAGGFFAALLLIGHPLQIWHNNLALADTVLTLLLALAALVVLRLAVRPGWGLALLLGALLGLAGADKLSPLLLTFPLAALGAWFLAGDFLRDRRLGVRGSSRWRVLLTTRNLGLMLLAQPLIAGAVFVVSYPYLWLNPIGRTLNLFAFRKAEMEGQARIFPRFQVDHPLDALYRMGRNLGFNWSSTENLIVTVTRNAGVGAMLSWVDLALAAVGLLLLAHLAWRHGLRSGYALTLVLLGSQSAIILVTMRTDFERYYLPILLGNVVWGGVAVGWGWRVAWNRITAYQTKAISRADEVERGSATVPGRV
ncbi:MAG: glycosyltransferase family 39 protein [Chloroflexia bacterium]|nr:glycosyltransferase family 39 protein [Chloroflexia bacterium]